MGAIHEAPFGALLRRMRRAAGLTQETLAERAGYSTVYIGMLERGERHPLPSTIELLANALTLSDDDRTTLRAASGQPAEPGPLPASPGSRLAAPPLPTSSLIGREREEAAVVHLLRRPEVRLLTLTGPGGVGKTRLAAQVAADLREDDAVGVVFVALAPLRDAALVTATVAAAVGLKESGEEPLEEVLTAWLSARQMLLVLDNFEQVAAAAPLLARLLASCSRLSVLVTSRSVLRLSGEYVFAVPPLTAPDPTRLPALVELSQYAAVALFVQRAQAVVPDFAFNAATAFAVAEICARLDGLPLAIELAAARIRYLSPPALLARLERRLPLLTGGARDLPERQQTLSGTISWSYDLLRPEEQSLFRRLAVFAGGCTLEAAEAVCVAAIAGLPVWQGGDVLDGLAALLDQSLLRQETPALATSGGDEEPRYVMLETFREFGLEQLDRRGEAAEAWRRYAEYIVALAERAEPELRGAGQKAWLDRLEAEHDNLRAVLQWASQPRTGGGPPDGAVLGLRLAGALGQFWVRRGHLSEGRRWLRAALERAQGQEVPPAVRAKASTAAGHVAWPLGDYEEATARFSASQQLYEELGDEHGVASSLLSRGVVAHDQGELEQARELYAESLERYGAVGHKNGVSRALHNLANLAQEQGDLARAVELYQQSLALKRELEDDWSIATTLNNLGNVLESQGAYERAGLLLEEALTIWRRLDDKGGVASALNNLGDVAIAQGDYARAAALNEQSLAIRQELGSTWGVAIALRDLGEIALRQGRYEEAAALFERSLTLQRELGDKRGIARLLDDLGNVARHQGAPAQAETLHKESLALYREVGDRVGMAGCLEGLVSLAFARGQVERAARLSGAATALREAANAPLTPDERARHEDVVALVRGALGARFDAAWQAGRAMPLAEAVAEALEAETPLAESR